MNKRFFNQQNLTRRLRLLSVLFAMLLMPIGAWAEDYPLIVAGVQVTNANASNILGDEMCSLSYDNDNKILTMKGANFGDGSSSAIIADATISALTIHLIGNNLMSGGTNAISMAKEGATLTFTTSATLPGSLDLGYNGNLGSLVPICNNNLVYTSGSGTNGMISAPKQANITKAIFTGRETYANTENDETYIYSGGKAFYATYAVNLVGNHFVKVSTKENETSVSMWSNELSNLSSLTKVTLQFGWGTCANHSVTAQIRGLDDDEVYSAAVSLSKADADGILEIPLTKAVESNNIEIYFSSTSEFSFMPIIIAFTYIESYGLTIAGVPVTSSNKGNVLGDTDKTVQYDSENNILTLNDATIIPESEEYGITYTGTTDLVISLNGTSNVVKGVGGCPAIGYFNNDVQTAPSLTFTNGSETDPCKLQLESVSTATIGGFGSVVNTGLYKIDETILGADQENIYQTTITSTLLSGGSGTSAHPFIVGTADDLKNFAKYVNDGILSTEYIKLGGNIDCTNLTGFEPIGNNTKSFIGTFNGDGNSIIGLTFSNTNPDGVSGLFGNIGKYDSSNDEITSGTVMNLTLSGCQFGNGGQNGAIAGYLHYGTIKNCTVTSCTISSGNSQSTYSGGITGMVYNGIVKDCTVNGGTITSSITNSGDGYVYAGGIVAYAYSDSNINGCTVTDVSINSTGNGQNSYSGGIVGYSEATISGNSVKGSTTVNSSNNDNIETLVGAIVANRAEGCSLTNNYYYYTVNTKTTIGSNDPVEKFGYTQRGIGGTTYNTTTQQYEPNPDVFTNNGAVMDTRLLAMPGESSPVTALGDEGGYYAYATGSTYGILGAPGKPVKVTIDPNGNTITDVSVTYGTDHTATITHTKTEEGIYFYTISEMPDADDATLNVTCDIAYDLWIGETQVTDANKDHILGEGNTSVKFAVTGNEAAGYVNTLTLNGAALTVPVKVGLDNLTIDIQGTNSITTDETCIQNTAASFVPSLTFKSTSTSVGSLILTKGGDSFITNIGQNNISVSKELAVLMTVYGTEDYSSNLNYITDGSTTVAKFVPSYGVQVNDMQVYAGNYTNVLKNGKVSFDKTTHTLTLNNANGIEGISTTLSTLDIDLVGSNSLYRSSNGSLFESASGDAVTINLKSTGATGALTMETPANFGATLIGENVTLIPVDPIEELSRDVAENKGTLVYGVDYDLSVGGVQVTSVNASNVFEDDETATVVFTPANNTASPATPATLTLNGATIMESTVSGLENLRVVINGVNTAVGVTASTAVGGDKNISFVGGTNAATLTISAGDGESAVSGFASVSYDGAYAAANVPFGYGKPDSNSPKGYVKSHMMGDNSYLETLTITTVPHYPIWLYTNVTTSTQVDNTNKNTLLSASGNVSFDGNHTLSLKNSVNCSARIVSGLSELTISVDGDCIIASPDTGSVVRSINASAPLTIEKASGASSASLKLAAGSHTAINAFASLDYTGLILLSEGATYTSGALNDSNNQPLNEAIFTTGLKKPTLQMNYETDTYSFQNPNGGGTLKYSRYFANNEYPDEKNQVDNGSTTFLIFKNGRQYNDPLTVICEVWVEANGNSSDKLYACRLDVEDMTTTYGGTVPDPVFLPKSVEGVTVSGYSLGDHTEVAATVTEGNITLTGAGRQELDAIFSIPDGVEYIKTSTTETPKATFFLDVKPATPILSKATGSYAGTQTITVTNLTPNATAMYYTYEGEEPENPNAQAFPEGGVDISSSKTLAVYYVASYETETSTEYLYSETVRETYTILEDPELKYMQGATAVTTAEWILGKDDNTALPTLKNTNEVAVTYESSDPAVATVAADGTVTPVGVGSTTITATSAQTDAYTASTATYQLNVYKDLSHSSITIEVAEATYNGAPLEPAVTVKDGETSIAEFVSVAYANNTNAALSTAETAPTVTVTATTGAEVNYYKGSAQKTFTITAMSLETVLINDIDDQTYTGEAITPKLMVTEGDKILILDTDYTVTYTDNVNAGTATATITGMGNYQGTKSKTFTITAKSLATGYTVSVDATQTYTYTGSAITPGVTVAPVGGGDALVLDTDYTVSYSNNVNAAKADDATAPTVTVTGKGNYTGTASATFTIAKADATITKAPTAKDLTYTGEAQALVEAGTVSAGTMVYSTTLTGTFSETIPTGTNADTYSVYYKVNGNDNYNGIDASETNKVAVEIKKATITEVTLENPSLSYTGEEQTATIASVKAGDLVLTTNDYDVSNNKATDKGSYELTVTAKENSNFTGSKTATFSIGAANITDLYDISLAETSYVYDGTERKPAVVFKKDSKEVTPSTDDYDVAYSNNVNVGSAEATTGAPTVTVTGKGNLTGSKTLTFSITAMSLNNAIVGVASATYSGSEVEPTVTVKLTADSTPLELDKDYTVAYSNNINAASADATTAPTATITGKGNYTGSQSVKFTIDQKTVTAAMIDGIDNQTYTGSAITPTLTVTDGTTTMVLNTDYSVDYEDNVNVGIATATITGEGNYKGTASKTFTIDPKELTADMVTLSPEKVEYNGATQKPEVTVADGTALTANDYTIENNGGVEVGKYDVVVTAKGNYTGVVTKQFEIVNRKLKVADVTFNENWASFYHPTENIDLPEGVAAYVLTAVGETTATATQISYIPAGVAVLLQNNVTTTTTNTSAEGNLMFHADEAVDVTTVGGTVYGLYNGKLMRVASGTIPAGKNFLVVSKPIGAPQLTITTDNTTAIEVLENAAALENSTDEWFTLDGRKLQQKPMKKGLYIKNGFKVVVNNK